MSGPVGDNVYRASGVIAAAAAVVVLFPGKQTVLKQRSLQLRLVKVIFVILQGGAFAALLPAGTIGDIIGFSDYASSWVSNTLTITPMVQTILMQ